MSSEMTGCVSGGGRYVAIIGYVRESLRYRIAIVKVPMMMRRVMFSTRWIWDATVVLGDRVEMV